MRIKLLKLVTFSGTVDLDNTAKALCDAIDLNSDECHHIVTSINSWGNTSIVNVTHTDKLRRLASYFEWETLPDVKPLRLYNIVVQKKRSPTGHKQQLMVLVLAVDKGDACEAATNAVVLPADFDQVIKCDEMTGPFTNGSILAIESIN